MVRFEILSGKQAGSQMDARRFPFRVGRACGLDLVLDDAGAWDRHCEVAFDRAQGFILMPVGEALVSINGNRLAKPTRLRNGDTIGVGACQIQFWMGDTRQRGDQLRESLVWLGIAAVSLSQVFLIYRLIR